MYEFCKRLSHIHQTLLFIRVNVQALLMRQKPNNIMLRQQTVFNIYEPKISIIIFILLANATPILLSDLQVRPWPTTYLNKCYQMSNSAKLFWNPCINVCYGPDKPNLWPFYHRTFKCDLEFQPTRTNVSNEQLCHIIFKSMHKCRSYGLDKLNLWPVYNLTVKGDLDLQPTWTMFQMALLLHNKDNCAIYLKSMHKCRSHGPAFNCVLDPQPIWTNVWNGTFTHQGEQLCQIPEQMFQMALLLIGEQLSQFFFNPCINVEVMARTSSIYSHFIIWPSSALLLFYVHGKHLRSCRDGQLS